MAGNSATITIEEKKALEGPKYDLAALLLERGAISFVKNASEAGAQNGDVPENIEKILDDTVNFRLNFGKVLNNVDEVSKYIAEYIADNIYYKKTNGNGHTTQEAENGNSKQPITHIHGPASSGISLASHIKTYLKERRSIEGIGWSYSKKENVEVTGEINKGDKVIIVDDFLGSGKTIRETYERIKKAQPEAEIVGVVVAMDTMEVDEKHRYVIDGIKEDLGICVHALVSIKDVGETFHNKKMGNDGIVYVDDTAMKGLKSYLKKKRYQIKHQEPIENYLEEEE
jgi:orotate phosphoribosyltransferase